MENQSAKVAKRRKIMITTEYIEGVSERVKASYRTAWNYFRDIRDDATRAELKAVGTRIDRYRDQLATLEHMRQVKLLNMGSDKRR